MRLGETMTSITKIHPGDQVYCMYFVDLLSLHLIIVHARRMFVWAGHCDIVHSVEGLHGDREDSSVFYIPAVPLSLKK